MLKKIASKVGDGLKNVGKKIVNTGAKVVKTVADLSGKAWDVIGKVGGAVGKVLPGAGKIIGGAANVASKIYGKITDTASNLAQKVIDKTSDKKPSSNTSSTSKPLTGLVTAPDGRKTGYTQARKEWDEYYKSNTSSTSKPQTYTQSAQSTTYTPVKYNLKPTTTQKQQLNDEPDVIINNYYNSGPRRDYVQHRHPSNRNYQPRNIGPRRMEQPPVYNHGIPMDIQRQRYQSERRRPNVQTYSQPMYNTYNEPVRYNQPPLRKQTYAQYAQSAQPSAYAQPQPQKASLNVW